MSETFTRATAAMRAVRMGVKTRLAESRRRVTGVAILSLSISRNLRSVPWSTGKARSGPRCFPTCSAG